MLYAELIYKFYCFCKQLYFMFNFIKGHLWFKEWELNPRQLDYESGALPTELFLIYACK